jgi:aldehyde dehydrogenase (NAD+)
MSLADLLPFEPTEILIAGHWRSLPDRLPVEDPSTGETIGEISAGGEEEVNEAVAAARKAFAGAWGATEGAERGRILLKVAALVRDQAQALARAEATDVGKPLKQALTDAAILARYAEFYAGVADKIGGETIPFRPGYTVWTDRVPHGVTAHIVPWNYPMQIAGRSVLASLAAGNACVLKPAEEASLTALWLARLCEKAGLPAGALNVVTGVGEKAGAALAGHPGVDHVSFTGSGPVGALVQAAAGRHAVPVSLELGGKSPQILFADADLAAALPLLVGAGIQNAGQTCSAGSRILVERSRYAEVVERMVARYRELVAAPALADRDLGPVISARQKAIVLGFIERARQDGLALAAEGKVAPDAPRGGHYVAPALFAPAPEAHELAREEIFGPVQVVIPFEDEAEALRIANGTGYGLVAGVWTRDLARGLRMARALRAGQVYLNDYGAGGGVELPFGGFGRSGHGREKGLEALLGLTRTRTVVAKHG